MKKIIILFLLINVNLYGYLDNKNYSVKARSLGDIATANLLNSDTVFYNPALLSYIKDLAVAANILNLLPDVVNNSIYTYNISVAKSVSDNGFGLGYNGFKSDNYNETLFAAAYSRRIKKFSAGVQLKYGNIGFEQNIKSDPLLNYKLSFFAVSVGMLFADNNYRAGFSVDNLLSSKTGEMYQESLIRSFNLGGAYNINALITVYAELNYYSSYFNYKLGASFLVMKKMLELNTGINKHSFNFGFSFKYMDLYIDYAVQYDFNFLELNSSQMLGIRVNL